MDVYRDSLDIDWDDIVIKIPNVNIINYKENRLIKMIVMK